MFCEDQAFCETLYLYRYILLLKSLPCGGVQSAPKVVLFLYNDTENEL